MDRTTLLRKLEAILAKAEQERTFGSIEIELRGGLATVIRKVDTERLDKGETTHAYKTQPPR